MASAGYEIGMVGLGTMGRSMVLNIADHGFAVAGYDRNPETVQRTKTEGAAHEIGGTANLPEFTAMLRRPRAIVLLVAPAPVVDIVIRDLLPHLDKGDLIVDAGNSYFKDTDRRGKMLAEQGMHFFGMGVSGGEAGARHGPSMMPGGPRDAYERVRPVFESVAARVNGEPCIAYLGPGSAGHYTKMVHNGIEYGVMQLIAETYALMKQGLGLTNDELADVYARWNQGDLNSFLVEITARIFRRPDEKTDNRLVDMILGVARQKGTGMWTSQDALELHVPIPTIDIAVAMRDLSGCEAERAAAGRVLKGPAPAFRGNRDEFINRLRNALYAAMVVTYAEGFALLRKASEVYGYNLKLEEIARIWRGGCIIRSALLDPIRAAFRKQPDLPTLLADPALAEELAKRQADLRAVVCATAEMGVSAAGMMASLATYDSYRARWLPANLIQAQRDYFGAHTYERVDEKGTFHTQWDE
jgi:6-phosphogluconate dehydrogenase